VEYADVRRRIRLYGRDTSRTSGSDRGGSTDGRPTMDALNTDYQVIHAMPIMIPMEASPRSGTARVCERENCETVLCTYNTSTVCWSCHASASLPAHRVRPALPDAGLTA
jgi:hypothetical protein